MIVYTAKILSQPLATSLIINTQTASFTEPDIEGDVDDEDEITVIIPDEADLDIDKTGPSTVSAGSDITYTVTVTNLGPGGAANVLVQETLPAGTTFVSANPSVVTYNSGTNEWDIGNLFLNDVVTLILTVSTPPGM